MDGTKSILQSKTIWGNVAAIGAALAAAKGYNVSADDLTTTLQGVSTMVAIGGSLLSIYGRITAKKKLT